MKRYTFRLAGVARIRAIEEKASKDKLMIALRELRAAEQMQRSAEAALAEMQAPTGLVTMAEFLWSFDQASRLSDAIRHCREAVDEAASVFAERRQAWSDASKKSQVLEKLEAQALLKWRDEELHEEVMEMDDMSNARHVLGVLP